jgi:RNA polymerase sigma-70 factor (ECF subfamily)
VDAEPVLDRTTMTAREEAEPDLSTERSEERALLPAHCRGEAHAFAALLAAYRAPVYGYLVRCGVEESMRDDLFQEIFLKVHGAASAYQPSRPLKPWLFTIVANTVRSHFRRRRVVHLDLGAEAGEALADPAPGPERALRARETAAFLERVLPRLPLAQREVLLLTCIEGMEQGEVAAALGIPVNTVKTHLRRGRLALAAMLAARDGHGDAR